MTETVTEGQGTGWWAVAEVAHHVVSLLERQGPDMSCVSRVCHALRDAANAAPLWREISFQALLHAGYINAGPEIANLAGSCSCVYIGFDLLMLL
jgi:hypothetical protein